MEKFRTKVKQRIAISSGMALVTLLLGAFSIYSIMYSDHSTATHSDGFVAGFQFGLIISILGFSVFDIVKLSLAINDETKLKILYNKEHDERLKAIRNKAGAPMIVITSVLMVLAAIIAGYFNIVVFYTLVIAVLCQLSISAVVKLVCMKTMQLRGVMMKSDMRKEVKVGILLFAIFNGLNLIVNNFVPEIPVLHFILGVLAGLAFAQIIIGILPEPAYLKLKNFKKNFPYFKK